MLRASELPKEEYHEYYQPYIEALGNSELFSALEVGLNEMQNFVQGLADNKLDYAYDEGKWTVAEVLMHLIDTERIFQYRALRFYRGDQTHLPGFDQNDFIKECEARNRGKQQILEEYLTVRKATISLFKSFSNNYLSRSGKASGSMMSVRALG